MRPAVPSSQTPAVWKQSSIRRGTKSVVSLGRLVLRRQVARERARRVRRPRARRGRAPGRRGRGSTRGRPRPVRRPPPASRAGASRSARRAALAREPDAAGEVQRLARLLARQAATPDQPAVGHEAAVAAVAHERAQLERPRLVAVELERRQQLHVLERGDLPARQQRVRGLGEALHAHHAGQHGRALDPVVVEERLAPGSSSVRTVSPWPSVSAATRRSSARAWRRRGALGVEAARRMPLLERGPRAPRRRRPRRRAARRTARVARPARRSRAAACRSPPAP